MKPAAVLPALAAITLLLGACLGAPTPAAPTPSAPAQSPVVLSSPTQTGTIVWFPPTRTPTPAPTIRFQATADLRPGLGELILSDNFNNPKGWSGGQSAAGTVSVSEGELTLANPGASGMLISLRSATGLSDYYLEINSDLSLCRGSDNYGLLLRAATGQDYYRFLLSCNGQTRLERVQNGRMTPLQDWTYSGQVPPGSPLILKLGVWALGSDLRFFINDVYQFSARDAVLANGSLGVFSRASGQTPLTVSFSNLSVYAIDARAVPTTAPSATITPTPTRTRAAAAQSRTPVFVNTSAP